MAYLKKLKNNLILTIAFSASIILSHKSYVYLKSGGNDLIPPERYVSLFIILIVFSFISQRKSRFFAMGFISILSFFQFLHLEFYGIPIYPGEFLLLLSQQGEIWGTLLNDPLVFAFPVCASVLPCLFLYKLNSLAPPKISCRYTLAIFIIYLIYNPARTYFTENEWGRQPSTEEFEGMNVYLSTSYFLGRILPQKINMETKPGLGLKFEKSEPFDGNIILILGESATPNHMSLFGYKRKTTPHLDKLKDKIFFSKGFSAGVSSDVSIAFFLNNTFGDQGAGDVFAGKQCLFKLAKDNDFKTYFYSTQSSQQLRYIINSICPKYIDDLKALEDLDPNISDLDAGVDIKSIDALKNIDSRENSFTILHQRGSHSPFKKRFRPEFNVYKTELTASRHERKINYYDNSILEFDSYMSEIYNYIQQIEKKTLVLYVSDHGEGLGEDGYWGHGQLYRSSAIVPIIGFSNFDYNFKSAFPEVMTHLNISLLLSKFLGFKTKYSSTDEIDNYVIYGNDIDGFSGKMHIETLKSL